MTGYDLHVTEHKSDPTNERLLELLEDIRRELSYLGTGRPPGSSSRGALELVAGSISGENGSLAERLGDGLNGVRDALDQLRDVRYAALDATGRYRSQAYGRDRRPDDSVMMFASDWLLNSTRTWEDRVPLRVMNKLYSDWCAVNYISPEDRVTTTVLRQSLSLLGIDLSSGESGNHPIGTVTFHVFTGVVIRDGVSGLRGGD